MAKTYPLWRWAMKAPGAQQVGATTMADRDRAIRQFTEDRGVDVHVLEYRTDGPGQAEQFIRQWTVNAKPKRGRK